MKKLILLLVSLVVLGLDATAQTEDARALALADRTMEAMGHTRFEQQRFLRFDFEFTLDDFAFQSKHLWDRFEGRYRVEWHFGGRAMLALFNVNEHQKGRLWVNGEAASGDQLSQLLDAAYYRFLNETYWLLMPAKMKDEGVHLEYLGQREVDETTFEMLHLTFDDVGMTPGDQYWVYINSQTGMMDRFAYYLERFGGEPSLEQASLWDWRQWEEVGGMQIARERVLVSGPKEGQTGRTYFPLLTVLARVDERIFDLPEVLLPQQ